MFMSNLTEVSAFCFLSLLLFDRAKKLEKKRLRWRWSKRKTMAQHKQFVAGERRGQMMPIIMCTMYYNQTKGQREPYQLLTPTINDRSPKYINEKFFLKCQTFLLSVQKFYCKSHFPTYVFLKIDIHKYIYIYEFKYIF